MHPLEAVRGELPRALETKRAYVLGGLSRGVAAAVPQKALPRGSEYSAGVHRNQEKKASPLLQCPPLTRRHGVAGRGNIYEAQLQLG